MQGGLKIFVLHGRKPVFPEKTVDIYDNLFYTVFNVGADAHIGPEADGIDVSVFLDRSGVVPHGAMRASPPTVKIAEAFQGEG
mgnify:FL=1